MATAPSARLTSDFVRSVSYSLPLLPLALIVAPAVAAAATASATRSRCR